MLQHLESIHYIVGVLTAICGIALWCIRIHIQLISQRLDLTDKYEKEQSRIHKEHADNCLAGLKEINNKLDKLGEDIARHNAEYSVLKTDLENVKDRVGHLEEWLSAVIKK